MFLNQILDLAEDKKILLLGLGKENQQFYNWLINIAKIKQHQIILADKKEIDKNLYTGCEIFCGDNYLGSLLNESVEYVFKAPGIWSLRPEIEEFRVRKGTDRALSSLTFFFEKFRSNIIAVTGTKGKSTTSNLITHLLNKNNLQAFYCGNTSNISPYNFWSELDQGAKLGEFFVVEISSFQLQDLGFARLSPKYGVITNYFVDHLDQHRTKEEYWSSKDNLFLNQLPGDILIANKQILDFSQHNKLLEDKILIDDKDVQKIGSATESKLLGFHNKFNLSLACLTVESAINRINDKALLNMGLEKKANDYTKWLQDFNGLDHRLNLVRESANSEERLKIKFYDDGFATEPDAVAAALKTLTQSENEFLWLQISGVDKGFGLEGLVDLIAEKIKSDKIFRIDCCGAVGERIWEDLNMIEEIDVSKVIICKSESFRGLVDTYFDSLENLQVMFDDWYQNYFHEFPTGKTLNLLFSPCGSSFDEFSNATQRADFWVETVKSLN